MITISESIDIDAAMSEVRTQWPRFVEWVLVGPSKLACDELICVDPTRDGVVRFEERPDGGAHVVLQAEVPGTEGQNGVVDKLRHDLLLFRQYVESPDRASGAGAREVATASLRKEKRRGRLSSSFGQGREPGLSSRPTGQAR
jgi:hypothetical protein